MGRTGRHSHSPLDGSTVQPLFEILEILEMFPIRREVVHVLVVVLLEFVVSAFLLQYILLLNYIFPSTSTVHPLATCIIGDC